MERKLSDAYADLHRRHWWFRVREEVVVESLRRHLPSDSQNEILDIGCGDGLLFDRLAEFGRVEGVEPDAGVISEQFRGQIHAVPFDERFQPGKKYTLVLMLDVLEHLPDAQASLVHALDLLVPGGILLITLPAFQLLWTAHDDLNHHVGRHTKAGFRAIANGAPIDIIEERYLFHALFPVKLAIRAFERALRLPPRVPCAPPPPINRMMRGYFRMEEKAFRKVPVPFGSSLLVVASKRL